jgi:hypothetical protein
MDMVEISIKSTASIIGGGMEGQQNRKGYDGGSSKYKTRSDHQCTVHLSNGNNFREVITLL